MTKRPWTTGEIKVLRLFAGLGRDVVAQLLDRSPGSIEAKAKEIHISLVINEEDIDISRVGDGIIAKIRETPLLQVCPICGVRLATMRATGVCRVCHLDQLIDLREAQLLELARERKLVKLRQDKRRLKVCVICGRPFFPRVGSTVEVCQECDGVV